MILGHRPRCRSVSRGGIAAVELALLLPFLCFSFVAAVDYARVFYYTIILDNCARNGALYASANPTQSTDTSGIQTAAQMDASNLSPLPSVSSSVDTSTTPNTVTVTVTSTFKTVTNFGIKLPVGNFQVPSQTTLTRSVKMSVVPSVPTFN